MAPAQAAVSPHKASARPRGEPPAIIFSVADYRERIDELAQLMDEFHLAEARMESDDFTVAFRRRPTPRAAGPAAVLEDHEVFAHSPGAASAPEEEQPASKGTPIPSPMAGIFYSAPNPGSPAFVKEGDEIAAGQIVGLIEAMKVFNEIPSPMAGVVLKVVAEGGEIVQPGDPLIIIDPAV